MDVARFWFSCISVNSFGLPDFKGSTFRGKFGHVLKRTICVMRHRDCARCALRQQCAYPYLFETTNERQQTVARPFVIEPPLTRKRFYLAGEPLDFGLVLIGRAISYLPYFVYCFERMGEEGIGQDRGRYQLNSVAAVDAAWRKVPVYDGESKRLDSEFPTLALDAFKARLLPQVTLHFYTPTDIRTQGQRADQLDFTTLLKAILRRYHSLRYFHGDGQKERFEIDWDAAGKVEIVHQELEGRRFKRYSNRQRRPVALAGFTGRITYRGDLGQFYPWIKIGELLHVGKNTVFGMGGYRVLD
ncbi:MAG: CRISPR system precrRNA processing endoribonuclease RAMP protein Cas6 [Calditrichaeota bacterium]|nr:MAG: CRISPR system precrRNA processing endoribonuclease RAMP protein Cas6 [Calditrichota bacterium]